MEFIIFMRSLCNPFCFLFLLLVGYSLNINNTTDRASIRSMASILIGQPTSLFPVEGFLKYILYGHSDLPFTYMNFLNDFGTKEPFCEYESCLIIGSDGNLGGITISNNAAILPIPGGVVTSVSMDILDKYFPRGFKILLPNTDYLRIRGFGGEFAYFQNSSICLPECINQLFTASEDCDLFTENNYITKSIAAFDPYMNLFELILHGYLDSSNIPARNGTILLIFYEIFNHTSQQLVQYLPNQGTDNHYIFNFDDSNTINYKGSIMIQLFGQVGVYNFSGYSSYD